MADDTERALRPVVGRLMATLGVEGAPDEYAQLLAQHISSENLSAVGVDLICRRLRERAPDARAFDANHRALRAVDASESDRFLQLLAKLADDKAVLTLLGDSSGASRAASSASSPFSPPPPLELRRDGSSSAARAAAGGGGGPVLSPASLQQLAAIELTPPSARPSPLSAAGGTPPVPPPRPPIAAVAAAAAAARERERPTAAAPYAHERAAGAPPARSAWPDASTGPVGRGLRPGALSAAGGGGGGGAPPAAQPAAMQARPAGAAGAAGASAPPALGSLSVAAQESALVESLLSALIGLPSEHLPPRRDGVGFELDASACAGVDPSLGELCARLLPLCADFQAAQRFAHGACALGTLPSRGLVAHALGGAVRELLREYMVLVCQLEDSAASAAGLGLQALWWAVQPALRALSDLAALCRAADASAARGGALLGVLQRAAAARAGTSNGERLARHVLAAASAPIFEMLGCWLRDGRVDDPHAEFFIQTNPALAAKGLDSDTDDAYWSARFALCREQVPPFLEAVAATALAAGRYARVLRECGVALPALPPPPAALAPHASAYEPQVAALHAHVSAALLAHLRGPCALLPTLRSIKRYLLLDQGDFFVHFLDISEAELCKDVDEIQQGKLSSCLELALRSSTAAHDPLRDRLSCRLLPYNLTNQLLRIIHQTAGALSRGDVPPLPSDVAAPAPAAPAASRVPGLDAFTFEFRIEWPLSIVVSQHALVKYQLLFRHLFHCKHVERQLSGAWLSQQAVKELAVARALYPAYSLRQRMLHLLHNLQYYMAFEVIEPRWHALEPRVRTAASVDEVIGHHHDFLDACLKECMLRDASLLRSLARLLTVCVIFADFTAVVMALVDDVLAAAELSHQNVRDDSVRAPGAAKLAMPQGKRRRARIAVASAHIREILAEKDYVPSVLRFERNFSANLTELIAKLQTLSAKDGMLANLVARLDFNDFYATAGG